MSEQGVQFVGFWARLWASLLDTALMLALTMPLVMATSALFGAGKIADVSSLLVNAILPAVVVILFWRNERATPGRMAVSAVVVDAVTGARLTPKQPLVRYLAYFVSMIPLGLGMVWVAFDRKKQGWHDKIAGTVVVRIPGR